LGQWPNPLAKLLMYWCYWVCFWCQTNVSNDLHVIVLILKYDLVLYDIVACYDLNWAGFSIKCYICEPKIAISFCMKLVEVITGNVNPNHQNYDSPIPTYLAWRLWGPSTFIEYPLYFQNHQKKLHKPPEVRLLGLTPPYFLFALVV